MLVMTEFEVMRQKRNCPINSDRLVRKSLSSSKMSNGLPWFSPVLLRRAQATWGRSEWTSWSSGTESRDERWYLITSWFIITTLRSRKQSGTRSRDVHENEITHKPDPEQGMEWGNRTLISITIIGANRNCKAPYIISFNS